MKTIHGLRNCSCGCRGLVGGICYRTRYGTRRRYFDSKRHVELFIEKQLKKAGMKHPSDKIINEETRYYIKHDLEKVYVKQPKVE